MARALVAAAALAAAAVATPSLAATSVPGGVLTSQTWTLAGSPYTVVGDVTVRAGQTLTIEAGVVVQFAATDDQGGGRDTARAELSIAGALIAAGTAASPVTFTGVTPTPGSWYGMTLETTAAGSVLSNVVVAWPLHGLMLRATGANTYAGIEVRNASGFGAYVVAGSPVLDRFSSIGAGSVGLYVAATSPTLTRCGLLDGGDHGVAVTGGASLALTLDHCTIAGNAGSGIDDSVAPAAVVNVTSSIVAANGGDGISRGTSTFNVTWSDVWGHATNYRGVTPGAGCISANPLFASATDPTLTSNSPARFGASDGSDMGARPYAGDATLALQGTLWSDVTLAAAGSPYDVVGDLTVAPGATLTIEAGTTLRVAASDGMGAGFPASVELDVWGALVATGTPGAPVRLEGAGAAGSWRGVRLEAGSTGSALADVVIANAVNGLDVATAGTNTFSSISVMGATGYGVRLSAGAHVFDGLSITGGAGDGLSIEIASASVTRCVVAGNLGTGVKAYPSGASALSLDHCTVAYNGQWGIIGTGAVSVSNSIVASNGLEEVHLDPSATVTDSDVWYGVQGGVGVHPGAGNVSANPLFASPPGDLRITSNSPARQTGAEGSDMGALPYSGIPTVGLLGTLWSDTTLTLAGGPHVVSGDLTVPAGVTLTLEPGVELVFASGDAMEAGSDLYASELRVLGALVADGTPDLPITLRGAGPGITVPWTGLKFAGASAGSVVRNLLILDASVGLEHTSTRGGVFERVSILRARWVGAQIDAGDVRLDRFTIADGAAAGLRVGSASATLSNSVVRGNAWVGVELWSGAVDGRLEVDQCTIANNGGGVWADSSTRSSVRVVGSVVAGNGEYGILAWGTPVLVSQSDVWGHTWDYEGASPGVGSISADPRFRSATDLRLQAGSPCLDAAPANGGVDADGTLRPIDGDLDYVAVGDMGAYEYAPPIVCGDGYVDAAELCDDGNADDADGCLSSCASASCGDGFVQAGVEGCDDANLVSGDGCSASCTIEEAPPPESPPGGCGGCGSAGGSGASLALLLGLLLPRSRRRPAAPG